MSVRAATNEELAKLTLSRRGYIFGWYRLAAKPLYDMWVSLYDNEEQAIAHMIWFTNITTRGRAYSSRTKFESVRDEWIIDRSRGGKFVKLYPIQCFKCKGKGFTISDKRKAVKCPYCDQGVRVMKPLYLHRVLVGDREMLISSFVKPTVALALPDYEGFDVIGPSRLPMSALLRMLSYYAVGILDMYFYRGEYVIKVYKKKQRKKAGG